ncbi:MAG: nuclear transport factor 2 family protein [Acidobacteria bacterium]|nr:nuclear transport factor 2 family protein [Acidobacteriota bacterium]
MTPQQLVEALYAAFSRGDIPFILAHISPDCRWTAPGAGIPNAGHYTGPAGVAEFFQRLAASESITQFEVKEYFTNGSSVIAIGKEACTSIATGKNAVTDWAMLFRVENGQVTEWQSFYDTSAYMLAHA